MAARRRKDLVYSETYSRVQSVLAGKHSLIVARIVTTENPTADVRRFLRHWANADFVDPRLRDKHPTLGRERRRTKSRHVSVHVEQSLEYLESAEAASSLTKPLSLFYAAENLAKAGCIFRHEPLDAGDFKGHGLSGDQKTKRYSTKNLACRVRGVKRTVWPALFEHFNADRYRVPMMRDENSIAVDWVSPYATKPLKHDSVLHLGSLLRHLPELHEDIAIIAWSPPFVVHVPSFRYRSWSGPPARFEVDFTLRHGHHDKVRQMVIDRESDLLRAYERVRDEFDVLQYRHPPSRGSSLWTQHSA